MKIVLEKNTSTPPEPTNSTHPSRSKLIKEVKRFGRRILFHAGLKGLLVNAATKK
jgi:hypothetical protein